MITARTCRCALVALLLVAPALHVPESRADVPADVPVVENPATPAEGRSVLQPQKLWRIGGYDETYLFGVVASSAIDDDGVTYLLDEQLSEITAVDTEGSTVATFGRAGEGPGEMDRGQAIMTLPDGRIGVLNMRPPKLITYTKQGDPAGDISLTGNEGLNFSTTARSAGDRVVVQTKNTSFGAKTQTSTDALRALDVETGEYVMDYLVQTDERDRLGGGNRMVITIGDGFVEDWALFADGSMAIVREADDYEIEILDADGTHVRTIRRAGERARRPKDVVDRDRAERRSLAQRTGMDVDPDDVETHYPAISSIHARPNGELWVLPGEGLAPKDAAVLGVFDVFDAEGRFVRQVEVRLPYEREQDRFSLHGDAIVVYENLIGARGGGYLVTGDVVAETEPDEMHADPLAISRYRF